MAKPYPVYETRILPALHHLQEQFGYLEPLELKKVAKASGIPLHRYHEVASFFPHFRFTKPPRVTLKICRDQACHLAGSARMLDELHRIENDDVKVDGVSCLGRCDRAVASCIALAPRAKPQATGEAHQATRELNYLGRSAGQLKEIVTQCLAGSPPPADRDADLPYRASDWMIDIYKGQPSTYAAVAKAVAARDASLDRAVTLLHTQRGWSHEQAEQFRSAARRRVAPEDVQGEVVAAGVLAWQTATDWAAGPELGGWSDDLLAQLDKARADLRGLGGAGFPATMKWRDVRDAIRTARKRKVDDRGFIVVNGDESEPSTFKDRELLLRAPHLILEGVILAGLVTEATQGFIYIRHEYHEQIEACRREIERAQALGCCGLEAGALGRPFPVSVFPSPGGYICGEESSLIEAMSDRRGEPRNMPPMLTTNGLDDRPTLLSNVETFGWLPYIWLHGGQQYADLGLGGWRGRRFFSVCGDVNRPGVFEVPMGMPLRELIEGDAYCRGVKDGRPLKALAPSGPSGGFLPPVLQAGVGLPPGYERGEIWQGLAGRRGIDPGAARVSILDLELELAIWRTLSPTNALGAGLCVYASGADMADQAVNAVEFYRNESCGKCVPCRLGSRKLAALGGTLLTGSIDRTRWLEELVPLVRELDEALTMTSICGLGRSVPMPLRTVLRFFADDLAQHLTGRPPLTAPHGAREGTQPVSPR